MQLYKLEFYVPEEAAETVKNAVFAAGAGRIGNYDCCCWQTPGIGQFRPLSGSDPHIGEEDRVEKVREMKIELVCERECLEKAISALKVAHPYETPAYQYWAVEG